MQSPKSNRPKAPGETPASDGLSETRSGGQVSQQGGTQKVHSPKGLAPRDGRHSAGVSPANQTVPTSGRASVPDKGSPGYAPNSSDASRKGGQREGMA